MKKIVLVFVFLFLLMCTTSCKYDPPEGATKRHHTYEEILEFLKQIDPTATVSEDYKDTILEDVMANEYREWNVVIRGIECHVASVPIIVWNTGVLGGEFAKKYFIIDTDYDYYLLKNIIENNYPRWRIETDDISSRYICYPSFITPTNEQRKLSSDELDEIWNIGYSIYSDYNLASLNDRMGIKLYAPSILCSSNGSNRHIEIEMKRYRIKKDGKEDFLKSYLEDWDKLDLDLPIEYK